MIKLRLPLALFFLDTVLADISLQTFYQMGCTGGVVSNVHPNVAAASQVASGCIALNGFQSVGVVSADSGFQCNIYSDSTCTNFLATFDSNFRGACTNIIGSGVTCFGTGQTLSDNPITTSTATITIGKNVITTDSWGTSLVMTGKDKACGDTDCDATKLIPTPFKHLNKTCEQTVKMEGFYNNPDERDYMAALLGKILGKAMTNERADTTGSGGNNQWIRDIPSFASVVMSDESTGHYQAMMAVTVDVQCNSPVKGNCEGLIPSITADLLGQVPKVGDVIATGFKIGCQV
ncbi:hypothetical protein AA313_de0201027 [Arthrobotrys entomopaga]|nr:hypothetical protein AA313_de0201027 [Arthrobotrys entomopaga]